jgi:hypothetical protein
MLEKHDNENDPEIKHFGVELEFSGSRTPQRSGKFERKFHMLYIKIRSMLNGTGLECE